MPLSNNCAKPAWPVLSRARHWWRQWQSLLPWEKHLVRELVFLMAALWLQLRLYSTGNMLKRTEKIICHMPQRSLPTGWEPIGFARRCDQLASVAAYHGFCHATCLPRSLAVYRVLRAHGLPARLRIGVVSGRRPLQAHAWVECGNEVLGEQVTAFHPLITLDEAGLG